MTYAKFEYGDEDIEAVEEFDSLKDEIKDAESRRDYKKYIELCDKLGIVPTNKELVSLAEAEAMREAKKESEIEAMLKEEGTKPKKIERKDFWKEFYDLVEREINQKRNVRGSISCRLNGFVQGRGYIAHIIYDFLGRKYKDIFADEDRQVNVREVLDTAFDNLAYYMTPHLVKKTGGNGNINYVQVGNAKELNNSEAYKIFLEKAPYATGTRKKRELLEECWRKQYGEGGETELKSRKAYIIERIFRRRLRGAEKRKTR